VRAQRSGRPAVPVLLALTFGLALTACGSDGEGGTGKGASGARTVEVALTDGGCEPARLTLPAGATTFNVTNKGTGKVSEFEVKSGERIEPVAESFGDLDAAIDARAGDVPAAAWGGFHKLEQALWARGTTAAMAPVARKLLADVTGLQRLVRTVALDAAQIANGANELLGEVSKSKITGEEERYSRTDLVDFKANVDGSLAAFEAVRPALVRLDSELAGRIRQRFDAVDAALAPYRRGQGERYVFYDRLNDADRRRLSQAIDALAEPLSLVSAKLAAVA
jgi:iron uptake system EfeUOB component EfeO/EfeM